MLFVVRLFSPRERTIQRRLPSLPPQPPPCCRSCPSVSLSLCILGPFLIFHISGLLFCRAPGFFFIQLKIFSSTSALYLSLYYFSSLICSLIFDSIHLLFSFHEDVKKLFSNIPCFKTCLLFKVYLSFFLISQLFPPHSFCFCIYSTRISSVCHFCEWVQFFLACYFSMNRGDEFSRTIFGSSGTVRFLLSVFNTESWILMICVLHSDIQLLW